MSKLSNNAHADTKRPTNNEVANLSLEILKRIPKQRKITAQEIYQQLVDCGIKRSLRTIQRTLETLSRDFDIEKDETNKPYGYRWINNNNNILAVSTMTPQESVLLSLAKEYLSSLLPPPILKSVDGYFEEAVNKLYPANNNQKERDWLKKVKVVSEGVPMLQPNIDQDVFTKVTEALYHNRILNIEFYNSQQENKAAQVMPLGLAQQGQRLYLVCRFDGYQDERNIAIHRVTKAAVSTFNFERPLDFKLNRYDQEGRFGFAGNSKCKIDFCISKYQGFHLTETPLSFDQQIIECQDYYQIKATVIDSLRFNQWLKGFGEHVWNVKKESIPDNE